MYRIRKIGEKFFVERCHRFLFWKWWESDCVYADSKIPYPFDTLKQAKQWAKETFLKTEKTGVVEVLNLTNY